MTDDTQTPPTPTPPKALAPQSRGARRKAATKEPPMPTPIDVLIGTLSTLSPAYLADTSLFAQDAHAWRRTAKRAIEDLDAEMDRLHAEIDARLARRQGFEEIIARCNAALGLPPDDNGREQRPAPQLSESGETGNG